MRKLLILYILILPALCLGANKPGKKGDDEEQKLLNQIQQLKQQYTKMQSDLQQVTEKRWSARQKQVSIKEDNKENSENLLQQIERFYSDVARAREELLARQNVLEREKEILQQKELEGSFFSQAINGKREQESAANLTSFPINQDTRMAELEQIDRTLAGNKYAAQKFAELISFKLKAFSESSELGIARRTFVFNEGEPVTAQVLRIGHSMAYAMTPDGDIYFLGSSGRLGKNRFEWSKITNLEMATSLAESFPGWIKDRNISGDLPVDILQNKFSSTLVGGERRTWKTAVKEFFESGGPILFPLALIILWALVIIINRLVIYSIKYSRSNRFINEAVTLLSKGEKEKARSLAQKRKGIHARILETCLKHAKWKRGAAEKSIKETLLTEVPQLDKHLNTLAVLAAAAPLLGLLGTVTGMIRMFEAITKFGTGDPKLLAGGISEALITTEVGLSIAIPLLLIHNFLRNRRNRIQANMERYAMQILNRIWPED